MPAFAYRGLGLLRRAAQFRHRLPWRPESGLQKYDIVNGFLRKKSRPRYLEIATATTGGRFYRIIRRNLAARHRLLYRCSPQCQDGEDITFRSADERIEHLLRGAAPYDVIFLDPWHSYQCSLRDLQLAFELLLPGGVMVVHDCSPATEDTALPEYRGGAWSGLTFCAYVDFVWSRPDLDFCTVDTDAGCGVVKKNAASAPVHANTALMCAWREKQQRGEAMFGFFQQYRRDLLNLVSAEEFLQMEDIPAPRAVKARRLMHRLVTSPGLTLPPVFSRAPQPAGARVASDSHAWVVSPMPETARQSLPDIR